ncbi:4-hydroxythreonine-4-phosphate dehydrogenase PdxA [Allohahella marinimesophila]|uniref:4-hydroxythreonine-4-phosphate dehydrogenase n=1 Tax=Allohahella marinimesophila TaxID=1054972 RepID=A0ABP7PIX3_9GAMM
MTASGAQASRPLIITSGEPAGVGPDLCVRLAAGGLSAPAVFAGDPDLLKSRAAGLGLDIELVEYRDDMSLPAADGGNAAPPQMFVLPVPLADTVAPGQPSAANGAAVVSMLQQAAQGCLDGRFRAVVTAPVNKALINEAGIAFSGHTEFFQDYAGVPLVVMMLASADLRVALVTTHLPLRHVADAITEARLRSIIEILLHDLRSRFGLASPRILVAGLNPHAGENGYLGREEIDIITPVLDSFRAAGHALIGPLPADTLFTPKVLKGADAVLAMYHDQGLPVLKYQGFGAAANITLGLPFVRTSVDHGTAYDLAGTMNADLGSLQTAVRVALEMTVRA